MSREYQTVYASNVLNVQPSFAKVRAVLAEIWARVELGGRMVVNYPADPVKHKRNIDGLMKAVNALSQRWSVKTEATGNPVIEVWKYN